jgi:hypothetical protein
MINGNMIGNGAAPLKTVIIEDADGNEMVGVVTGSEVIFTATDNDVRSGFVYASDGGISTGTKDIPAYRTYTGQEIILPGSGKGVQRVREWPGFAHRKMVDIFDSQLPAQAC